MENLSIEFEELKRRYGDSIKKLIPLLPSLIAMHDFRNEKNLDVVRDRLKKGYYGTVVGEKYVAPTEGPYVGILTDISAADLEVIREIHATDNN
jgi:hypothetical protein